MDFTDIRYIRDIASDALAQYSLCGGDLLFTRYNGSLDLTAVCGVVDGPPKPQSSSEVPDDVNLGVAWREMTGRLGG